MTGKYLLLAGTVLTLAGVTPAFAQDAQDAVVDSEPSASNDIIVTANRREQRLQDVAVAVSALNSEALQTRGIASLGDLSAGKVPGLVISPLFGAETGLQVYVRGFGAGDASQGTQDLPVAIYIDGVNFPRAQGAGLDLVTPERIEVLRGPQGQLFGRNAHSGAVQVISKRPSGHWEGDLLTSMGTYNSTQIKGRLDLPEFEGFRVQLSGNWRKHDGYTKNPFNPNYVNITYIPDPESHAKFKNRNFNGDYLAFETYGGRAAVERDFGDLNFFYSYDNSWGRDDQGVNEFRRSDQVGTVFTGFSPVPLSDTITFSNLSGPGGTRVFFSNHELGNKFRDSAPYGSPNIGFVTKSEGHILNLTYMASDNLTLKSITGRRIVSREGGQAQNAVVNISSSSEYMESKMLSQEFQAIYTTDDFNITAGALYFEEDVLQEIANGVTTNCATSAVAGPACFPGSSQATSGPSLLPPGRSTFKRTTSDTEAYGLYAQGTYFIGDFELTAGVRYSDDTKDGARTIDRPQGIDGPNGIGVVKTNRFHTSRVDPAFTVKYNINDDMNVYGRYAVGYRDGGTSVRSSSFSAFGEDEIESWEIGFKSQWFDRRMTFNAAAFYNTIKNQQISIQEDPLGNVSLTDVINSPQDRTIKGLELDLTVNVLPGLTVSGTYTYLKSEDILMGFDIATKAPFIPTATFTPQTGLIPDAATVAAHPNSQLLLIGPVGTPKHSGSVNVDYVVPMGESNVLFHVDWAASSNFLTASPEITKTNITAAGAVVPLAGYNAGASTNRVNARIAFRDIPINSSATAEFGLWAKNLFDHLDSAFAFAVGVNSVIVPQPPRVLGADFRIRF